MGAVLGTIGHEFGVRAAGGMVTMNTKESVSALIEQAATDGDMQAELGALLEDGDMVAGSPADDFSAAMAGKTTGGYMEALSEGELEDEYAPY